VFVPSHGCGPAPEFHRTSQLSPPGDLQKLYAEQPPETETVPTTAVFKHHPHRFCQEIFLQSELINEAHPYSSKTGPGECTMAHDPGTTLRSLTGSDKIRDYFLSPAGTSMTGFTAFAFQRFGVNLDRFPAPHSRKTPLLQILHFSPSILE
jgi:hypothetical protein